MTAVNISGTFKKDSRPLNGLEAIAKQLLDRDNALATYVVVGVVRPHAIKWLADDGMETPTVRFESIEVLDGAGADRVREMIVAAYRARTGKDDPQEPLPFGENPARREGTDVWLDDTAED